MAGNDGSSSHSTGTSVAITASAQVMGSKGQMKLIHLISVSQPVQSWTVYRHHDEFEYVASELQRLGFPSCPPVPTFESNNIVNQMAQTRNELQDWLSSVLNCPGASSNQFVNHLLCSGANHPMPSQYETLTWYQFVGSSPPISHPERQDTYPESYPSATTTSTSNADELDMDDMFVQANNGLGADHPAEEPVYEHYEEEPDDDEGFSAMERYQPTEEPMSNEEVMEFERAATDDVEMIEDVGSLAQSMGASHLGRSLNLQAELSRFQHNVGSAVLPPQSMKGGLKLMDPGVKAEEKVANEGGIGNAVRNARPTVEGLSDSFCQKKPVSQPRLDSFKMVKVIGKGSFGKVFLVKEKKTDEMFALKVLTKDNIIRRNQVEHTKTERNVLGYVNHPFIVGLKMAFQSRTKLYFVLDYCAGGELFFHLSKVGKFPELRARFYAAEIVCALAYVHALDIVYRDLKPENVLLDAKGHIRLTDFGLSKEGISLSTSGANSFCGTPEYLAPEILNRHGHGRAVDWWSLGALLYEMLTGLPPFYCKDRDRLFEKIRHGTLDYPSSLSSRATSILKGLLTKNPEHRLGSGPDDADSIKKHLFFYDTDWEKLTSGEIRPPWEPSIGATTDTSWFDDEFTKMPVVSPSSYQMPGYNNFDPTHFHGFTYTDNKFYGGQS